MFNMETVHRLLSFHGKDGNNGRSDVEVVFINYIIIHVREVKISQLLLFNDSGDLNFDFCLLALS